MRHLNYLRRRSGSLLGVGLNNQFNRLKIIALLSFDVGTAWMSLASLHHQTNDAPSVATAKPKNWLRSYRQHMSFQLLNDIFANLWVTG